MTILEDIANIRSQLLHINNPQKEAELQRQLLDRYASINSPAQQIDIDRLSQLAEELHSELYKAWSIYHQAYAARLKGDFDYSVRLSEELIRAFTELQEQEGIARTLTNIGNCRFSKGDFNEALKKFSQVLENREAVHDRRGIAIAFNNIAHVQTSQGNFPEALKNNFASLKIREEIKDRFGIAGSYNNIGQIHTRQGNREEALKFYLKALDVIKDTGDNQGLATVYQNIGSTQESGNNSEEAMKNYSIALAMREKIGDKSGIAESYLFLGSLQIKQGNYEEALNNCHKALEIHKVSGEKRGIASCHVNIGAVYKMQNDFTLVIENNLIAHQIGEEIGSKDLLKQSSLALSHAYKETNEFENALIYHEKYHQVEQELLGEQAQKQLISLNFQHNIDQKEKQLEIEQLRNVDLKRERDRSESLLLNILPAEVAEELKEKGTAGAKLFNDVTVVFTDFVSFTNMSEVLSPQQLVDELHACFSAFDEIITRYNIEKIKTVGDAYLAVSGLPLANQNHACDIIKATVEMRDFMLRRNLESKQRSLETFEVRIGVHSGSVVAGIVGVKKFAYDIWGDTVNTAARMEQNSEAGKINISGTTFELVKHTFNCLYRGEIEAKNKGKLKMYFVENALI